MIKNMTRKMRGVALLVVVGLAAVACEQQKISEINSDPARFKDKEVAVVGTVTSVSFGVLGQGIYQIDDGTGSLYVYSDGGGVPTQGAHVGVKGRVLPTFTFLGKNYATVLRETGRRSAD